MLALLDEVPGVAESRVDWTGRRFLLTLEADARDETVVSSARSILGGDAHQLSDAEFADALADYRRGEKWMRSGETLALSRVEAGVLAQRHAAQAAGVAGLDERQHAELEHVLEHEIAAAFERIHEAGEGLPASLDAVFDAVRAKTLARVRGSLTAQQVRALERHFVESSTP